MSDAQDRLRFLELKMKMAAASKQPEQPLALDTGLRAMTGSMNPNPPNILPKGAAEIPYISPDQAGSNVADNIAETGGKMGFPKTAAALGTAFYAIPKTAKEAILLGVGGNPVATKGADILTAGSALKPAGAAIGEAEKVGGVLQRVPDIKTIAKDLGLPKGTTYKQLVNHMSERLANGVETSSQSLRDFMDLVKEKTSSVPNIKAYLETI